MTNTQQSTDTDPFVVIDGGLVDNRPAVPVYNLEVLRVDFVRDEDINDALNLFEKIIDDGNVWMMTGYLTEIADFIVVNGDRQQIKQLNLLDERIHSRIHS